MKSLVRNMNELVAERIKRTKRNGLDAVAGGLRGLTCHQGHRASKPLALYWVRNPMFRLIVEEVNTIGDHNMALLGESSIRQAAIKIVNDIALVISLGRSSETGLMMKHNSVG